MNTIDDFLSNARAKNLCERGAKIWEHCNSKKQLVDFCLSSWGMEYVATAIAEGWGISAESIEKDFGQFTNGRYIRDKDGYTSTLFCNPTEDVKINSTAALIVNCKCKIIVNRPACELHIVNSNVEIIGKGNCAVYLYNSKIANSPTAPAVVKEDKYYGVESSD